MVTPWQKAFRPIDYYAGKAMTPTTKALDHQEGGNHYKKWPMQPIQFSMLNHYDPCAHDILKYVVRYKDKGGLTDLRKALHYIDLRYQLLQQSDKDWPWRVNCPMTEFVKVNQIEDSLVRNALYHLDSVVRLGALQSNHYHSLRVAIQRMIDEHESTMPASNEQENANG